MPAITTKFGTGGTQLTPGGSAGKPSLATVLRGQVTDANTIKAAIIALAAKLDLDDGITDTDYEAVVTPLLALINTAP